MSVVSNTTVLSNFAAIGQLDKLRRLFPRLAVPLDVVREVEAGREEGYLFCDAILEALSDPARWLRPVSLAEEEIRDATALPSSLHAGEAAGLALAVARGWLFLTDDRAARREAASRGVRVSGSLGCLAMGARRGLWSIATADGDLRRMVDAGYFSPVSSVSELLET